MSQAGVERILGKLITDEDFRARFFRQPEAATFAAGVRMSPAELDALRHISIDALAEFSLSLDPRVCRLCVEVETHPDEVESEADTRIQKSTGGEQ